MKKLFANRCWLLLVPVLLLVSTLDTKAQKRKGPKKPASSSKKKGKSSSTKSHLFFWPEIFGGYLSSVNQGDYLDFQRQYYYTENPDFSIKGEFADQYSPLLGASFHLGIPVRNPVIKFVSGGLALSWSARSLGHEVNFTNTALPYRNAIFISENFSARYLSTEFQLRFGSKVYGLLGIRNESLLAGFRERKLRLEGDSIQSGKAIELVSRWDLKNSELVKQHNLGWHAAIGYSPFPVFGMRLGLIFSNGFFREDPDFSSRQLYFALCFGIVK